MSGTKYAQGYAAGAKRVAKLQARIEELRRQRDEKPPSDPHDVCIDYLLKTAEVFTDAADSLINIRLKPADPNDQQETSE